VNDSAITLQSLIRALSDLHIHRYDLFAGDFVPAPRTCACRSAIPLSRTSRFTQSRRDREIGLALYRSPNVASGTLFPDVDPLRSLSPDIRRKWRDAKEARGMIETVLKTVPGYPDRYGLGEFADKNSV